MAKFIALLIFFLAGTYAERVAKQHAERKSQAARHASDFVPGHVLPVPQSAVMPGASMMITNAELGSVPQINIHGAGAVGRRALSHRLSHSMSMQDDPGYVPDIFKDSKSTYPNLVDAYWSSVNDAWKSVDDGWESGNDVLTPTYEFSNVPVTSSDDLEGNQAQTSNPWGIPSSDNFEGNQAQISKPSFSRPIQLPREDWPFLNTRMGAEKFYRYITSDDPTFEAYGYNTVLGYVSKTPDIFVGSRIDGTYQGSHRVMFSLPAKDDDPMEKSESWERRNLRTIEFLQSNEKDNPSFGAVEVTLPLDMAVAQLDIDSQERLVVTNIKEFQDQRIIQGSFDFSSENKVKGNAANSMLRRGDIIRAVSLPEPDGTEKKPDSTETPWWRNALFQTQVPVAEDGMVMLDALGVSAYDAALQENLRMNGKDAKVVLLIERPAVVPPPDDENDWWKGLPFPAIRSDPSPSGVMIPIPVEKGRDPRYPPLPRPGGGPQAPQGLPPPRGSPGGPQSPRGLPPLDSVVPLLNTIQGARRWSLTDALQMSDASDQMSGSSDPVARDEEDKKRKTQNEYKLNLGEAVDSLSRDIPQMLRLEDDSRRVAPMNWDIYTDSLETDFTAVDPTALALLGAVTPAWTVKIKGLTRNKRALQQLQRFVRDWVEREEMTAKIQMGVDPSTGVEVIEAKWRTTLTMKRLQIPRWLFAVAKLFGQTEQWTPESVVHIEAVSRYHLNAEGKIYLHLIDKLDLLVDQERVTSPQVDYWLQLLGNQGQPVPRLAF